MEWIPCAFGTKYSKVYIKQGHQFLIKNETTLIELLKQLS